VKGVTSTDDAKRAIDVGADAVSVSNHGGNGLDGAPATIRALPHIVEAVGDQIEVLLDGGVRRGGDVVKAVALGARAVLIGRPYIWALAAGGEPGVADLLRLFNRGIDATLRLLACPSVADLDPSVLRLPTCDCGH
jgi:isopentenyl diphosphate isomerase/L-lactate dehydrogenase-like FMN-dependent dehydrogenase